MGYLEVASHISTDNLNIQSQKTQIAAGNIGSSGVEGATRKEAKVSTLASLGKITGIQLSNVTRSVDKQVVKELNKQSGELEKLAALKAGFSNIEHLFGTPDSQLSLNASVTSIINALGNLTLDPPKSSQHLVTITTIKRFTDQLNTFSTKIQEARLQADLTISDSVTEINEYFEEIYKLNSDIVGASIRHKPTAELLDKRDLLLKKISKSMDIIWYERPDGDILLMSAGKQRTIVDAEVVPLEFTPLPVMTSDTVYPSNIKPILLGTDDITTEISSGRIKSALQLRDEILPNLQAQVDELAKTFMDEINRVYSHGTPIPPTQRLTGLVDISTSGMTLQTPGVLPSAVLTPDPTTNLYGSMDLAILDANGISVGTAMLLNLDQLHTDLVTLNAGPYTLTLRDVMNAVNGHYQNITTAPAGVQPAGWTNGAWPPVANLANPINGLQTQSGQAGPNPGTDSFMYMNNNYLEIGVANATHGIAINDTNTTLSSGNPAQTNGLNYIFGLNNLLVKDPNISSTSKTIKVRDDIAANPSKLSRGLLTIASAGSTSYVVTSGDARVLTSMTTVLNKERTFNTIGGLAGRNLTFSKYAADILSNVSKLNQINQVNYDLQENRVHAIELEFDRKSGINLDNEHASLITIQASYAASAAVVRAVQTMYGDLMGLIR